VAASTHTHREKARRARHHWGIDFEIHLPPATRSFNIFRSLGVTYLNISVVPSSTDAWRGPSTQLLSPPATSQLSANVLLAGWI
jgi:hypothetical protein